MMDAPKFVTMRLGKDSVDDIKKIDACASGAQEEPLSLTVVCKQVPRTIEAGTYALLWLGSDNSKGAKTEWTQGFRAVARIEAVELGEKNNDDSNTTVSIGYVFPIAIGRISLLEADPEAYTCFSEAPIVGLDDRANQTIREIEQGARSDVGALLSTCVLASRSSLSDLLSVYPELNILVSQCSLSTKRKQAKHFVITDIKEPRNLIYFGAPGTGKSHQLNKRGVKTDDNPKGLFPEEHVRRVTFYPDYTYSQFVGSYRPFTKDGQISYEYVPGPFLQTYLDASLHPYDNYLLIVEEINRANPAAVFGDVFQLLDRNSEGASSYSVAVPLDMSECIKRELDSLSEDEKSDIENYFDPDIDFEFFCKLMLRDLSLPPNMYIWATMNSADQGVSPMDTAFKRRWDFRYIGIDDGESAALAVWGGEKLCDRTVAITRNRILWNELRKAINTLLLDCGINEDKLLGPFFLAPEALNDTVLDASGLTRFMAAFEDKVLLYLYEDAGKMKHKHIFQKKDATFADTCGEFERNGISVFVQKTDKHEDIFGKVFSPAETNFAPIKPDEG